MSPPANQSPGMIRQVTNPFPLELRLAPGSRSSGLPFVCTRIPCATQYYSTLTKYSVPVGAFSGSPNVSSGHAGVFLTGTVCGLALVAILIGIRPGPDSGKLSPPSSTFPSSAFEPLVHRRPMCYHQVAPAPPDPVFSHRKYSPMVRPFAPHRATGHQLWISHKFLSRPNVY